MEEKIKNTIVNFLQHKFTDIIAIYLFGSIITEYVTSVSDIDIAILTSDKLDNVYRWRTSQELASQLNRDVDLIDLRASSTAINFQVVSTGKRIYTGNFIEAEKFADLSFSLYIQLNEERKEILNDIQQRGTIYG